MSLKNSLIFVLIPILFSCASLPVEKAPVEVRERSLYETHIDGAEAGNPSDQIGIGRAYEKGSGVEVDFSLAMEWYKKAAAKGAPEAYFRIGELYEYGRGVSQSDDDAREWYYSAAVNQSVPAIGKLIVLLEGRESEQMQWIEKGMEANDPYSFYRYGLILEKNDREAALRYFKSAASAIDPAAQALVAILSLGGKIDVFGKDEALEILRKGAEGGDPRSQVFTGWLYEFGDGVESIPAKALQYYESAARSNSQLALYNLSRFYGEGIAVESDPEKSNLFFSQLDREIFCPSYYDLLDYASLRRREEQLMVLYRFKASQGNGEAQYELGKLSSDEDAYQWFWLAAQKDYVPAMAELARVYLKTDSSLFDPVEGIAWLMVAENSGFKDETFNSSDLLSGYSREEKLDVSRRFTDLFYKDNE
ncbi:MAG: sel1 repeat family protein [Spirochaetales bacterium]|nr:sel1 repeat family protein [Spirochaetales bacterium]